MRNKKAIATFSVICMAYWLTYQGYDSGFFLTVEPIIKHGINFTLLVSVAIIGYRFFIAYPEKWAAAIWLLIYSLAIVLISVFGLIDLLRKFGSQNFRDFFGNLRMFLTSPIPFSVLLFIGNSSKTYKNIKAP